MQTTINPLQTLEYRANGHTSTVGFKTYRHQLGHTLLVIEDNGNQGASAINSIRDLLEGYRQHPMCEHGAPEVIVCNANSYGDATEKASYARFNAGQWTHITRAEVVALSKDDDFPEYRR